MPDDTEHIAIADFAADCLWWLDQVVQRRYPVIITKEGKPVAEVVPLTEEAMDIFGCMAGTITICGDIISPIEDLGWTGDEENI